LFAPSGVEVEFVGGLTEEVTGHAGAALMVEVMRSSGVLTVAGRVLPAKKNAKGLRQGQMVESVVVHSMLGGECMDDMQVLREDRGLAAILGYEMPAPSTLRSWLEQYHDEDAPRPAVRGRLAGRPKQGSFIPQESPRLAGLAAVTAQSVRSYVAAVGPPRQVTLDVDAHLVESTKREALWTYEGYRGFQPMVVVWAETGLIVADQFRDGNVPASVGIAYLIDAAYATLPARTDGWEVRVRSDTAAYEEKNLAHWSELGWKFAIGADMTVQLRQAVENLRIEDWHEWQIEPDGFVREWAEVDFVPGRKAERRDGQPYRYLAIRVRSPQGRLFADGVGAKIFAVVTNDWETPGRQLLQWQRGKAGSVEHAHRELKDELAAGVYPSAKFGANAAWLRLQVLTSNLLTLLAATALDEEYRHARPKRLRFAIFDHVGTVVSRTGQIVMQVISRVLEKVIGPGLRRSRGVAWQAA
jgi:hypothetical protein